MISLSEKRHVISKEMLVALNAPEGFLKNVNMNHLSESSWVLWMEVNGVILLLEEVEIYDGFRDCFWLLKGKKWILSHFFPWKLIFLNCCILSNFIHLLCRELQKVETWNVEEISYSILSYTIYNIMFKIVNQEIR